jgi:two-component system sensor histidine kinase BarA
MNRSPLRSILGKILLAVIPPLLLLGVLLSTYAINARLNDFDRALQQQGEAGAQQLASLALLGLFSGNQAMLHSTSRQHLLGDSNAYRVEIRDQEGNLVASAERVGDAPRSSDLASYSALVVPPTLELDVQPSLAPPDPLGSVTLYLDRRSAKQDANRIITNALLIMLAALMVAIAIAIITGRQIVRPLTSLREALNHLREGRQAVRVDETEPGEIGELQKGFNAMAAQVSQSTETLQRGIDQATADLQQTMEALKTRNAELDRARQRECDANRSKSAFLANMSHEIRTPMNGVLGFANLLKKTPLDATQQEFVDAIERSGNNLLAIINDILDFSKMEAGKITIEKVPFSLRNSIEDVVGLLLPKAREKGLVIVPVIDPGCADELVGDVTHLGQILTNLLGNAIKFTETGTITIRIGASATGTSEVTLDIEVCDTGIGIAKDQLGSLFQPFNQGSLSTKRLYGGTGLGLSITQSLVKAMGGHIAARSEPGRGTCFTMLLPFAVSHFQPRASASRDDGGALRVALVDPDETSRRAIEYQLQHAGMLVSCHSSVPEREDAFANDVWLLCPGDESGVELVDAMVEQARLLDSMPVCLCDRRGVIASRPDCCAVLDFPAPRARLAQTLRDCSGLRTSNPGRSSIEAYRDHWLQGLRFLIADDNDINLLLVDALLRSRGAETILASDGAEAVALAMHQAPDMVLMDVHMPNLNGIAAARQIRAQETSRSVPIVALTADITMPKELSDHGMPFDAILVKPVDEQILRAIIAKQLHLPKPGVSPATGTRRQIERPPARPDQAKALINTGGLPGVADGMGAMLTGYLPEAIGRMRSDLQQNNWEGLRGTMEQLRGSTEPLGTPALLQAIEALASACQSRDRLVTASRLDQLQQEVDRLIATQPRDTS